MMDLMTFEDPCLLQMMDSEKDDKQEQLQTLYFLSEVRRQYEQSQAEIVSPAQ